MNANISTATRRRVYRRDGYSCALCDSTRFLQIHHHIPRGEGGGNSPHNLSSPSAPIVTPCAMASISAAGSTWTKKPSSRTARSISLTSMPVTGIPGAPDGALRGPVYKSVENWNACTISCGVGPGAH